MRGTTARVLGLSLLLLAPAARAETFWFDAAANPSNHTAKFRLAIDLPVLAGEDAAIGATYRQRSLWDVDNDDDPFRVESNFHPEVFVRHEVGPWRVQASFVHESNGLEGELSRGWNRWAATVGRSIEAGRLSVTAWAGFRVEDTNPDLRRTVGDGEVAFEGRGRGRVLPDARARFSLDPLDGSPLTSLRLAARVRGPEWLLPGGSGRLLFELFWGRGEMLQENARITRAARLGVVLRY